MRRGGTKDKGVEWRSKVCSMPGSGSVGNGRRDIDFSHGLGDADGALGFVSARPRSGRTAGTRDITCTAGRGAGSSMEQLVSRKMKLVPELVARWVYGGTRGGGGGDVRRGGGFHRWWDGFHRFWQFFRQRQGRGGAFLAFVCAGVMNQVREM